MDNIPLGTPDGQFVHSDDFFFFFFCIMLDFSNCKGVAIGVAMAFGSKFELKVYFN